MPAVNIYDTLYARVNKSNGLLPMERRAMFWFKRYAQRLHEWQDDMRDMSLTYDQVRDGHASKALVPASRAFPGHLYFFTYDAKHKATLPYFDQFPFVLVLDTSPNSFTGLNFHYLDYYFRAMFFDALYSTRTRSDPDLKRQLRVTYDLLQVSTKYRAFRPCLKRYLHTQVQSPLLQVGMSEWDVALFLPVESFSGATTTTVWRDSESRI